MKTKVVPAAAAKVALATVVLTFLLLIVGGTVHATGSSLACPDWPLCYGDAFPTMEGGVLYEHSHRLLASAVGLCTLVLAVMLIPRTGRTNKRYVLGAYRLLIIMSFTGIALGYAVSKAMLTPQGFMMGGLLYVALIGARIIHMHQRIDKGAALGMLALQMVILQGLLGGLTVVHRLPLLVSASHLGLSLVFFCTIVYLTVFLWGEGKTPASVMAPRGKVVVAAMFVYLQCILGALVRHLGAGTSCGDSWLLCQGSLLPMGGPQHLHMTHRFFALVVAAVVIAVTIKPMKAARLAIDDPRRGAVRFFAIGAHVLLLLQIALGALTVASYIAVPWVAAHLGVAALLLVDLLLLYWALGPAGSTFVRDSSTASASTSNPTPVAV